MRENQDKTLQQLAVSPIVHSPLQREESGDGCVLSVAASYLTQQLLLLLHLHPSFTSLLFLHLQKLEQSVRGFLWYDPFASKIPLYQNCMHMRQTIFCNFFTGFANCC
jgi:hypothetical protein